ncbi:CDGSH iron-sulfur domain-containing protein [Cellulomonas sp. JZ18]|uniref:CDGSH iron-sulfur domain-containing protein n=1 Tax=Cellulomonas sp. JZ18 TaxID=2654191 RepID=UPI0012D39D5A|nr:CDGSH iron-sulfur domain-containing protein [Cellulomonas sp. JZ18]QGQ19447.1 CDGSH iron-sulfur domain-containing protein [Cellulomonas sp. JZ18]
MTQELHRTDVTSDTDAPTHGAPRTPAPRASVTFCPDGPVLVRGDVELRDEDGMPVTKPRPTVALCRCGGSAIKPWCDGTHKVNGYRSLD